MKPKDSKTVIFYLVSTIILWQFGAVIRNICIKPDMQFITHNNPILSFVFAKNTGGAFSIMENLTALLAAFGIVTLVVVFLYVYKKLDFEDKFKILACVVFSAGILGNLIERVTNGYVIDFIRLNFVNFAIFNSYDIMISFSVIFYAIYIAFEDILKVLIKKAKR